MTNGPAIPQVRIVVVGLGLMGERHCKIITAVPGAKLVGIYDYHDAAAARAAAEHGVECFSNFEELLQQPDVDAVVICLPSSLHAEFGIRAAAAGKHVIIEKPIDSQSSEAKKLADACSEAGVICTVISQNRYSVGLATVKAAIEQGIMGNITLARASVKWYRHDEYYTQSHWRGSISGEHGGVLMNQAIHSIDTLQWLFGRPSGITGFTRINRPDVMETEDTAVALFQWDSGLLATLEASTCAAPGFDEAYEFHSPIASARVVKGELDYWHHREGLKPPAVTLAADPGYMGAKLTLFYRQYLNILAAIRGEATLDVQPAAAIAVVETVEGIYKAARTQ